MVHSLSGESTVIDTAHWWDGDADSDLGRSSFIITKKVRTVLEQCSSPLTLIIGLD